MRRTWLVVYEPLLEIITFSWKKYYIKEKHKEKLESDLENKKFLKIKWSLVNVSSVERVDPASNDISQVESKLLDIPKDTAEKIRQQVYVLKENNSHKTITDRLWKIIIIM
jgi:hypothetical protein